MVKICYLLLLLLAASGLPRPESRHRRQILASQACLGPCQQNFLDSNGVITRQFSGPQIPQQSNIRQTFNRGGPGAGQNVFGPFGSFSQIFG